MATSEREESLHHDQCYKFNPPIPGSALCNCHYDIIRKETAERCAGEALVYCVEQGWDKAFLFDLSRRIAAIGDGEDER